jgi:hypothetical protein
MCIAFAIDGQPFGPLEYLMVSKRWEKRLLETPSLWSQVYIQNGEDELARISAFLHLSRGHSLHVDIMIAIPNMDSSHLVAIPNMDSLQLIASEISRVATISIRPGATKDITSLYMEQWRRSTSYLLATIYSELPPPQVLSNMSHTQCPVLSLRENNRPFHWVTFMEFTMRNSRKFDPVPHTSVKSAGDWKFFRMWEEHIKRCAKINS